MCVTIDRNAARPCVPMSRSRTFNNTTTLTSLPTRHSTQPIGTSIAAATNSSRILPLTNSTPQNGRLRLRGQLLCVPLRDDQSLLGRWRAAERLQLAPRPSSRMPVLPKWSSNAVAVASRRSALVHCRALARNTRLLDTRNPTISLAACFGEDFWVAGYDRSSKWSVDCFARFARLRCCCCFVVSLARVRVPPSSSRWGATVISCLPRHLSLWSARHRSTCRMTCLRALPASSCAVCRMSRTIRAAPRSPSSPSSPARCSRSFAGAAAPFWACCSSTRCSRRAASITRTSRPCCGGCARCCARARPSTRARSRAASCARRDCCLRSAYGAARLW